jgi:hypothetical protein
VIRYVKGTNIHVTAADSTHQLHVAPITVTDNQIRYAEKSAPAILIAIMAVVIPAWIPLRRLDFVYR